jgi:DNA helicase II / ATP-dependent DNA helicase PcrA
MDQDQNKQLEQKHLDDVLEKVHDARKTLESMLKNMGANTLQKLKEFRDSPDSGDFYMFLDQLDQQNAAFNFKDKFKRYEELEYLIKEPYFSRIGLFNHLDQVERDLYIGKFGYTEDQPIVTDWRAKIASVYYRYRYPQKNVKYETPGGPETADLLLKRTFEIDNGEILKVYNNDIQLDENEIITDKIEQRTGGVLEDIVETIQVSQLDIIESEPRQVTIVQGCVGSGKSTVAIHKLSHIFFNYPTVITPQRSLLVAKNQILVGYLSTLFPKLGIFDITYKTLRDLIVNVIFREKLNITFDMDSNTNTEQFDLEYKANLDDLINNIHTEYDAKIKEVFNTPEFEPYGGYKYAKNMSIIENIDDISKDLEEEYVSQNTLYKENPTSPKSWFHQDNAKTLRKIIYRMARIKEEVRLKALSKLLKEVQLNTNSKLDYFQTLLYLYIHSRIFGFNDTAKYEYCVVDEGQDFSILEYSILSNFVLKGRFAIFGDLNQSITEAGVTKWDDISAVIEEAKSAQVYSLDTNYRSTKPIIDLANKILSPYTENYLPKSINRRGDIPLITKHANTAEMFKTFEDHLDEDLKHLDKSIGIICFGDDLFSEAEKILDKKNLNSESLVKLEKNSKIVYVPKAVYITHFDNCKGLEFAKIYVLGLNLDKVTSFGDAKKAFVAVTRAMNEVNILGIE